MALFEPNHVIQTLQRPNQINQTGDINALAITEFTGMVEGTIERRSVMRGWVNMRSVRGTNSVTNYAIGEAPLGKVTPGEYPQAFAHDFSKKSLTVDTVVYARAALPLLEVFQTNFDARREIATEHGKKIAKFFDQSMFIQAAKASLLTQSGYSNGTAGKPAGHAAGNVVTLAAAGDAQDPAMLYQAIRDLFVQMQQKDVVPQEDDLILAVPAAQFYALQDNEMIANGNYITSEGNSLTGVPMFKAFGVPVITSNNIPQTAITGHLLSNTANGNAYDGDFSKLVAQVFSAKALLAGETIPLETDVFYDKLSKTHFVDAHLSYGVTPNRAEYAGSIWRP